MLGPPQTCRRMVPPCQDTSHHHVFASGVGIERMGGMLSAEEDRYGWKPHVGSIHTPGASILFHLCSLLRHIDGGRASQRTACLNVCRHVILINAVFPNRRRRRPYRSPGHGPAGCKHQRGDVTAFLNQCSLPISERPPSCFLQGAVAESALRENFIYSFGRPPSCGGRGSR